MTKRAYRRWVAFLAVPVATAAALWFAETELMTQPSANLALDGVIPQTVSKVLDLNSTLADLFMKLATALIGGLAYYLQLVREKKATFSGLALQCAIASMLTAVLSIFFGHLWLAGMRNQLANDYFNAQGVELIWPERLQYYCFLSSLAWFAVLGFLQERAAIAPAA